MHNPLRRLFDPGDWLAVKPRLDPAALTLTHERKPDPAEYKLRIGVGLFVMAVVALIAFLAEDGFVRFVAGGFGVFGLLNVIYGTLQSGFETTLTLSPDEVRVTNKTIFGRQSWREPISSYQGVSLRESQLGDRGVGTIRTTRRFQIIELVHEDDRKTVALFVDESSRPPRDVQRAFAERFRLPEITPGTDAEDSKRGGPPGPPPSGVTVERDGAVTRIGVGTGRLGRGLGPLVYLAVAALFGYVGYQIDPVAGLIAGGMALLLFAAILALGRLAGGDRRPPAICLTDERVWIDRPKPKTPALIGSFRSAMQQAIGVEAHELLPQVESLPLRAVERIRVDDYVSHSNDGPRTHPRLLIEADAGRLEFIGAPLDRKKLEWVRRYLESQLGSDEL
jgi:hypothetical protein